MSLPEETQQVCKVLLESEMVMKSLPLMCVDLTWNDSFTVTYSNPLVYTLLNNQEANIFYYLFIPDS
jgi:hypothetical protein